MVSVTDRSLRSYARKHILRRDDKDYKQLTVPGFSLSDYQGWHKREVVATMKGWTVSDIWI